MRRLLVFLTLLLACVEFSGAGEKGYLLLIGGKDKPANAVQRFVELAGDGLILVIPSASEVPLESGPEAVEMFKTAGAKQVEWLYIAGADTANNDSVVAKIRQARAIFFTGGVQTRLMERIGGTRAESVIRELYFNRGGLIGGTSAGTAVQSQVMITGDGELGLIEKENIKTARGLGFLSNCVVDQHFVARQRNNRLITVVIETGLPGIGIDESTAIIYHPDDTFQVYGTGSVIVYDPRSAKIKNMPATKKLSIERMSVSVLCAGQRFDLKKGRIKN